MGKKLHKRRPTSTVLTTHSVHDEVGTDSPIHNFRPGIWRLLERDREIINLDLFWPFDLSKSAEQDDEQNEDADLEVFPYDGLRPLLTFRNLHTLRLTGMVRSYQPLIWASCWLNPNLTTLHLEMALEPLLNDSSDIPHRQIDGAWTLRSPTDADEESEYLGHHGTGVLHEEFGDGEYLDTQAIKMAQLDAADELPQSNMRYLPIKKLTLMNFVVDAWPTLRWFDPKNLEEIVFKPGCVDAGFYLSFEMMHIKVQAPTRPVGEARVVKVGELKVVELKKGKVVSRKDAVTRKEELNVKQHPTLRHKISQIFPRMARRESVKRNKENKAAVVRPQNANVDDLQDACGFSEAEIRAAKDGKKPAR
jgi:hypothetical protein